MDPKKQIIRLKKHLKLHGFSDVKIKIFHGEAAARTDSSHPFVSQVKDAADKIFWKIHFECLKCWNWSDVSFC